MATRRWPDSCWTLGSTPSEDCIVFTRDMERGMRVCRQLEVGMSYINNYKRQSLGLPFGGVKESGNTREHCMATLHEYSSPKSVQVPSGFGEVAAWRVVREVFDGEEGAVGGGVGRN